MAGDAPKQFPKLRELREIEQSMQAEWYKNRLFELDAPEDTSVPKFLTTFPYPYMNGRLHLGHSFSLSKCEFAMGFERLKGKLCLWPFGFHCTGMPIKACADKLKYERDTYGCPPKFPDETVSEGSEKSARSAEEQAAAKGKAQRSKAKAKAGGSKWQWDIMRSLGLTSDEEIARFCESSHWLSYFPPIAIDDLQALGVRVDWRRSFITTDVNPFYDSFVRWQFEHLYKDGRVRFGKRHTIYSPLDGQSCQDHERATGEGVAPQEYTLVKLRLLDYPPALRALSGEQVFLAAATLRPETMYGQTNCWVHPDIEYVAFDTVNHGVLVATRRAARNMAHQDLTQKFGQYNIRATVRGAELIGCAVSAPLSSYERVYILPMLTVREQKGTGVVTSVPSDSPDDYAALRDLMRKPALREKYGLPGEKVEPFKPVPIIDVPQFGNLCAVTLVESMKIASQNETEKLAEAKDQAYLKGFYEGVFIVDDPLVNGRRVKDAKRDVQQKLIDSQQALLYKEPEKLVVSRSGDECVVALCDQWYLDYGDESWKARIREYLPKMQLFSDEVRRNFIAGIDWLEAHSCSRSFGLGTRLPFDPQYLIESLSDSTIYMAFYTVAHLLLSAPKSLDGSTPGPLGIKPQDMTSAVWDYIFLADAPLPSLPASSSLTRQILDRMRREFRFWYPVDVRVSGKDLITNHLTFFLYNHEAIWPKQEQLWPRAIRANGHLMLNGEKMSKSTGNFMTLREAIDRFSADGMRAALADAGDTMEDANFVEKVADSSLLRLYSLLQFARTYLDPKAAAAANVEMREPDSDTVFHDAVFVNELNRAIIDTERAYERMAYKDALKIAFYELDSLRDRYREMTQLVGGMRRDLVRRYLEVQCILLAPICPHTLDYIWTRLLGQPQSVHSARWPTAEPVDQRLLASSAYFTDALHEFRLRLRTYQTVTAKKIADAKNTTAAPVNTLPIVKPTDRPTHATIFVARSLPQWQQTIVNKLRELYEAGAGVLPENKAINETLQRITSLNKHSKKIMPFVQTVREAIKTKGAAAFASCHLEFDELSVLRENACYLQTTLDLDGLEIVCVSDESEASLRSYETRIGMRNLEETLPGTPIIAYRSEPALALSFTNTQPRSGFIELRVPVRDGDSLSTLFARLNREDRRLRSRAVSIFAYRDILCGPRTLPTPDDNDPARNNRFVRVTAEPERAKLAIDMVKGRVELINGDSTNRVELGTQLVYVVS